MRQKSGAQSINLGAPDTFTSIEGLAFDWQLESKGSSTNTVLRFLTFEASPYETVPSVDYWEKQGLKGYIVLVEGIGTGAAAVSVTLNDPKFKDVKRPSITLIVVANLMLNPAHDVYLLPDCHVQYKVELIKQGRPHEIKMPSDQYYLEVKNSDTVHLDSSRSDVTGLSIGSTTILLNDKNTTNIGAFRQPSAGIHVVTPHHIGFDVRPGSNWVLQTSNRYEISVRLYSLDNREIYPSDDGTEVKVEEQVENDQLVETLLAEVASYTWKSSNPSIVQIKKDGSFATLKPGVVQITAFDSNNKLHYDTAEIAVLEVAGMDILPSPG
ncbi:Nuclear pore membrane glycoprotein 210 [Nymphon striatum]|nr:Nuclear pore membrane glycoprotein 210 [Nymphon striatum]